MAVGAYHLVQAGRKDDLRRLLLDFNYLQAKLAATDPNALIADYDYLAGRERFADCTISHSAFGARSGSRSSAIAGPTDWSPAWQFDSRYSSLTEASFREQRLGLGFGL